MKDIFNKGSSKKYILPATLFLIIILIIAFFLTREKAIISKETTNNNVSFLSYDIYGEDILQLINKNSLYMVVDKNNKILLKTSDIIKEFSVVGNYGILYISEDSKEKESVKFKPFNSTEVKSVYHGKDLRIDSTSNSIYIVDKSKNLLLSSSNGKLHKVKYKGTFQNIFTTKDKVFITTSVVFEKDILSSLSQLVSGNLVDVYKTKGLILSADIDYNNRNKLYLSIDTSPYRRDVNGVISKSILINNVSSNTTSEDVFLKLKGTLLSLKNGLIFIEKDSNKIYSLYSDMSYKELLGTAHRDIYLKMIRYTDSGNKLYYINSNDKLVNHVY